jgi:hypothetical protein
MMEDFEDITHKPAQGCMNSLKFIVIKSISNSGKSLTCKMLLMELIRLGASVHVFRVPHFDSPNTLVPTHINNFPYGDFYAELQWNNKEIIINSEGDTYAYVSGMLIYAIAQTPDYIICTSRSQSRGNATWKLFEKNYLNNQYSRISIWSEFSSNPNDKYKVKEPTIQAIIKYLQ